ncbi:MAG: alpha/beta hydrolase [Coxiellaceae bacterium]|nr:alpha/beta hydrolase [Coxiellaceae bacterium]
MTIQSNTAFINNIKLHYLFAGSGKLLLLLHGFPEFSLAWHKQIDFFSTHYFVVAPDLRGFNLSEKPKNIHDFQMKNFIDDIDALIKYFKYEKCIIVGHDIGGSIAQCFSAQYPNRVEKLVLINSAHPQVLFEALQNNSEQQKRSAYVNILRDPRAEKMIASHHFAYFWQQLLFEITEKKLFSTQIINAYETAWRVPGAMTGMLNYYRAWPWGINFSDKKLLSASTETLIIWGEKDRSLCDDILNNLSVYIPNHCIKKIPDGSHWLVHEVPALVAQCIRSFI